MGKQTMVNGLDLFKRHFDEYHDCFVLIGGAACDLLFDQQGIPFRLTKDLDIVLFIEVVDERFLERFWEFIRLGRYRIASKSENVKTLYRFEKPFEPGFPSKIEIFTRSSKLRFTVPISISSLLDISSHGSNLSAILLDDNYYHFIREGVVIYDGFPQLNASHLIPLKIKAFLNLLALRINGERVKSSDLKKHFRDVFRLHELLSLHMRFALPNDIAKDMKSFLKSIREYPESILEFQNPLPNEETLKQLEVIFMLKEI
jgi:hypothetical protein